MRGGLVRVCLLCRPSRWGLLAWLRCFDACLPRFQQVRKIMGEMWGVDAIAIVSGGYSELKLFARCRLFFFSRGVTCNMFVFFKISMLL